MPFVDLLHKVPPNQALDLLLHTGGGSIDVAEKLIGILRRHAGEAKLRVIVPELAKSAGTVMVLGADSVVMSDMSELGPIDPQALLFDRWQSVQNYLDAYSTHAETLRTDRDNVAARIMLGKLDPATLKLCEAAVTRARQAAENLLKRGMFRNGGNWSWTVSELLDTTRVAIACTDDLLGRRAGPSDRTRRRALPISFRGVAELLAVVLSAAPCRGGSAEALRIRRRLVGRRSVRGTISRRCLLTPDAAFGGFIRPCRTS